MAKRKSNKDPFARFMERAQQPVPLGPEALDEVSDRARPKSYLDGVSGGDTPKSLDEISTRGLLHMLAVLLGNQGLALSPVGTIVQILRSREYRAAGGASPARDTDTAALRDLMHAQSNELWTVQALLKVVMESPDTGDDQLRLLNVACRSLGSVQEAFQPHI
jgi:hypothetical protein